MVAWTGIGMNYGHNLGGSLFNSAQNAEVESDLTYLASIGITRVRVTFPLFSDATSLANAQNIVQQVLTHGFYAVWGVATAVSGLNATTWSSYKSYVTGTLANWAQSNGLPELSLGNEVELHVDDTTLTAATVRSDVRSMATTVKNGGYTGKVSYHTSISSTYRTPWISEGIGSLDYIGWNSYDTLSNFQTRTPIIVSAFGNSTYISEFGCISTGFPDYNDESAWYTDVVNRVSSLKGAGVQFGYFYTYRDDSTNTFALVLSNGQVRSARDAIKNVIAPAFSSFQI